MILLKNISKTFNGTNAVQNINLEFPGFKTSVIIGPSGCGKSTLIRLITFLIKPDSGSVQIKDEVVSPANILNIRRKIGYVIQDGGLFPHLTAFQNVAVMANFFKWDKNRIEKKVSELSELTKFPQEGLAKYPLQLSGGQKQRISLMRALMLDPKILLLDEPLGALDPLIRYDLQNDLKEIFNELKITVVMVTHDLNEAAYFGDNIILMKDGEVEQEGRIYDLLNHPKTAFVTKFVKAQRAELQIDE